MLTQNNDIVLALHRNGEIEKTCGFFSLSLPMIVQKISNAVFKPYFDETIDMYLDN